MLMLIAPRRRKICLGVIFMFPYQWGTAPMGDPAGMTAGIPPLVSLPGFRDLPEDIRAGLEEHQNELRSEDDYWRLVNQLMLRR